MGRPQADHRVTRAGDQDSRLTTVGTRMEGQHGADHCRDQDGGLTMEGTETVADHTETRSRPPPGMGGGHPDAEL